MRAFLPIVSERIGCVYIRVRFVQRLGAMALIVATVSLNWTSEAFAVCPFVTDDARIIYRGQVVTESYGGITMAQGEKPAIEARSLQGIGITDRLELTAGGLGFTYHDNQARPLDILIQPKYVPP